MSAKVFFRLYTEAVRVAGEIRTSPVPDLTREVHRKALTMRFGEAGASFVLVDAETLIRGSQESELS